jgi:hypothetical protein
VSQYHDDARTVVVLSEAEREEALLAPMNISNGDTLTAALVLAGGARHAAELRDWLEITGLIPAGHLPRRKPAAGCANTVVNYRRPGS